MIALVVEDGKPFILLHKKIRQGRNTTVMIVAEPLEKLSGYVPYALSYSKVVAFFNMNRDKHSGAVLWNKNGSF